MKIAITGHRPNKLGNDYDLTSPLVERIEMLSDIENNVDNITSAYYNDDEDLVINCDLEVGDQVESDINITMDSLWPGFDY